MDRSSFKTSRPNGRIAFNAGGKLSTLREKNGAANGQTFGPDGWIVFCEQNGRRFSRMRPDGSKVETLVETFEGRRLNSPNDVVCKRDGTIVFTDPPYGVPKPEDKELSFNGVFALCPGRALDVLVNDFEKPNGLAFSPDESILYINDTAHYHTRAFSVNATTGKLVPGSGRVFAKMEPNAPGGPDGMKVDRSGRVYIAVALGVWVYEADGNLLGILQTPSRPANLAWGGADASNALHHRGQRSPSHSSQDQRRHATLDAEGVRFRFRLASKALDIRSRDARWRFPRS